MCVCARARMEDRGHCQVSSSTMLLPAPVFETGSLTESRAHSSAGLVTSEAQRSPVSTSPVLNL